MSDTTPLSNAAALPIIQNWVNEGDTTRWMVPLDDAQKLELQLRAHQAAAEKVLAAWDDVITLVSTSRDERRRLIQAIRQLAVAHTQSRPRAEGAR
jgi:hypothetical protein